MKLSCELGLDPRVELVCVMEALSKGNPCPGREPSVYLDAALAAFDRSHPACAAFAAMGAAEWRHRHPSLIILDFTDPPELAVAAHFDHYREQGKEDALARLLPLLRSFCREQDFMGFFRTQERACEPWLAGARETLGGLDYAEPLERYIGALPPHRYRFLMAPLLHGPTPHNVLYEREGRLFEIVSISGHSSVDGGRPLFDYSRRKFLPTAWHEVAHTVVDSITREHAAELEPLASLYGLMTGLAKAKYCGPPGWLHMIDEHVIRAVTARLEALEFGEEAGLESAAREKKDGFALIGPVYQALREYERDRSRYPTLRSFYPRLIAVFRSLASFLNKGGPKAGRQAA